MVLKKQGDEQLKKNAWIMNHYASGMFFEKGGRHYAIAKYMRQEGYRPVIFCCNSKHGKSELFFDDIGLFTVKKDEEIDVPFVFVKGRPYSGNGKTRVLNMVDFYFNVQRTAKIYAKNHGKPDVIYASSVHPLTLVAGIKLAKYFGVKCICEVRDLWPESFVAYGILGSNSPVVVMMRRLEKWIYKKTDRLVFTMEGAYDYIVEQHWEKDVPKEKVVFINNGVDLELFDYNKEQFITDDEDLKDSGAFKIVYTGSIRMVNNLGLLIDAAKLVKSQIVKFLIWGDGDDLEKLQKRVQEEKIDNVFFKGSVQKKYIPYITSCADINIMHGQSSPILRFGLSPNKLFDYLASGKPILVDFRSVYNPASDCNACVETEDINAEGIARTIDKFTDMDESKRMKLGRNARKGAEAYDFKILTKKLVAVIDDF